MPSSFHRHPDPNWDQNPIRRNGIDSGADDGRLTLAAVIADLQQLATGGQEQLSGSLVRLSNYSRGWK